MPEHFTHNCFDFAFASAYGIALLVSVFCPPDQPSFLDRRYPPPLVSRNLNYWDSAASFAGEVENPGRTYPRALLACVGLVILCYGLPILVGTGSAAVAAAAAEAADSGSSGTEADRWSLWVDGYFADVAQAIAGRWLGVWVVLAAAAANIGLFEAEMTSDAFQLMGMVRCCPTGSASRCPLPVRFV